jgi:hypothetical protein
MRERVSRFTDFLRGFGRTFSPLPRRKSRAPNTDWRDHFSDVDVALDFYGIAVAARAAS